MPATSPLCRSLQFCCRRRHKVRNRLDKPQSRFSMHRPTALRCCTRYPSLLSLEHKLAHRSWSLPKCVPLSGNLDTFLTRLGFACVGAGSTCGLRWVGVSCRHWQYTGGCEDATVVREQQGSPGPRGHVERLIRASAGYRFVRGSRLEVHVNRNAQY